jgi:RNA polymerase sigma-70 factor (ECF subfamily)
MEDEVRASIQRGALDEATSATVRGYGPEVLGFLVHATGDEMLARDAFSWFCESVWRGLPGFRWEATLRTWCYVLARRSIARARRDRPGPAEERLSSAMVENLAESVTTSAMPLYQAQVAQGIAALRAQLTAEDRMLLTLRVDRELSWREIVSVLTNDDDELAADELDRRAAGLRKRYERAKLRLHELARDAGFQKS